MTIEIVNPFDSGNMTVEIVDPDHPDNPSRRIGQWISEDGETLIGTPEGTLFAKLKDGRHVQMAGNFGQEWHIYDPRRQKRKIVLKFDKQFAFEEQFVLVTAYWGALNALQEFPDVDFTSHYAKE